VALAPARLAQFAPTATVATYYDVPGGVIAIVKNIVVANTAGFTVSFTLSIVPSGQTAGNGNRIVPGSGIPSLGTLALDLTQVMHPGDSIAAFAGTAGVLAVTISGLEG
jgi:hypothetical protein